MQIKTLVLSLSLAAAPLAFAQSTVPPANPPQQSNPPVVQQSGRSAAGDIGSGTGDAAKGAGKGVGRAAEGVGKGAGDVVTLHPVDGAEEVGKGAVVGSKDVVVGAGKGTGKVAKGTGKIVAKPFKHGHKTEAPETPQTPQ